MAEKSFVGMDVAVIRSVATKLLSQSHQLASTLHAVDSLVADAGVHWLGHSAVDFRHHWQSSLRHQLDLAAHEVESMARSLTSNADQQEQVSSAGRGTPAGVANSQGDGHVRDPRTLAAAADAGYGHKTVVPGFHPASDADLKRLGITPAMLRDPASGFQATVLVDKSGHYIVAFAGTDPKDAHDIAADAEGATYLSRQTEEALTVARLVSLGAGKDDVTFTGHSLGGRLAALSSVATGAPAVTFNSAGVSDPELLYATTLAGKPLSFTDYAVNWPTSLIGIGAGLSGPIGAPVSALVSSAQNIEDHVGVRGEYQDQVTNYTTRFDPLTAIQDSTAAPNALGHSVDIGGGAGPHAHDLKTVRDALDSHGGGW